MRPTTADGRVLVVAQVRAACQKLQLQGDATPGRVASRRRLVAVDGADHRPASGTPGIPRVPQESDVEGLRVLRRADDFGRFEPGITSLAQRLRQIQCGRCPGVGDGARCCAAARWKTSFAGTRRAATAPKSPVSIMSRQRALLYRIHRGVDHRKNVSRRCQRIRNQRAVAV